MNNKQNLEDIGTITQEFSTLDECTDFYYDEFGKLSQVPLITNRERKNIKKVIYKQFGSNLKAMSERDKLQRNISKAKVDAVKQDLKDYKANIKNNTIQIEPKTINKKLPAQKEEVKLLEGQVEVESLNNGEIYEKPKEKST